MFKVLRWSWTRIALVSLTVLLIGLPTVVGCGDSPYKSQVKRIIADLQQAEDRMEAMEDESQTHVEGSLQEFFTFLTQSRQIATDMSMAVAEAQSALKTITPPDAEATAFHSQYVEGLDTYADNIQTFSHFLDYCYASFTVLGDVMPPRVGDIGIWQDVSELGNAGVSASNVARAASVLDTLETLFSDAIPLWEAIALPSDVEAVHTAVGADLENLAETFGEMAMLADEAVASGSEDDLAEINSLWDLAADQYEDLLEHQQVWFDQVMTVGDDITSELNELQEDLDDLEETLD